MLVRLTSKQSGTEGQKNQDEQVREVPATNGEVEDPAPQHPPRFCPELLQVLYPLRSALERANLARADKTETTVSTVSPLKHTRVGDL